MFISFILLKDTITLGIFKIITSSIKKLISTVDIYCINAIMEPISNSPALIYPVEIYTIAIVAIFIIISLMVALNIIFYLQIHLVFYLIHLLYQIFF